MRDPQAYADVVVLAIKSAMAPVLERLAVAEAQLKTLGDVRDRVVAVETKAAMPVAEKSIDLAPVTDRLAAVELGLQMKFRDTEPLLATCAEQAKDITAVRERLAVLETRPQMPGPPGQNGAPGKDGEPGKAGMSYEGVYQDGKSYDIGHLVTWGGSSWHCNEPTDTKPGDGSKAWTLMVKRGRDGKDGRDGHDLVPVVRVGA